MSLNKFTIAVLGGTGALGTGLGGRLAQAGHKVVLGSRDLSKAQQAASDLNQQLTDRGSTHHSITAQNNETAAAVGDIVILTVPHAHQLATLNDVKQQLDGKILIDVTVPLVPPKVGTVQLPAEGSAVVAAQKLLGETVRVVSAFQNVAAAHLQSDHAIDCDILICSNDKEAAGVVVSLAEDAGMKGFYAGPLANSAATEALTSLLITINRLHKCHAGIRLTGLPTV